MRFKSDKEVWREHTGQDVAVDEVTLFFNNNTYLYAHSLMRDGMSQKERVEALMAGGFQKELAKALVKQGRSMGHW